MPAWKCKIMCKMCVSIRLKIDKRCNKWAHLHCPPATYFTPNHQLIIIVQWWYTCRKDTCLFFFLRMKKACKEKGFNVNCRKIMYCTQRGECKFKSWAGFSKLGNCMNKCISRKQLLVIAASLVNNSIFFFQMRCYIDAAVFAMVGSLPKGTVYECAINFRCLSVVYECPCTW